jgi:hypothetical protein
MRGFVSFLIIFSLAACKSDAKQGAATAEQSDEATAKPKEEAKPPAPATKPDGPPGVAPLASVPRENWPCAKTVDSVGARVVYDYTDAPDECWFPPDLWQPGCPTRHVQGNPDLGLEIEVGYRYDDEHRLVAISSKLRLASVEAIEYEGGKVVSQDSLFYYPAGNACHLWHKDGSFYASVDYRKGAGIARLQTGADAPGAEPTTDEKYEYEGDRLARIRGTALGTTEIHEFQYDCDAQP